MHMRPNEFTTGQLSARFNLSADEVIAALKDLEPIGVEDRETVWGRDALEALRAAMIARPIRAIPASNGTIRPLGE